MAFAQNNARMKRENRQKVLRIIRKAPISRADLARHTGLTRAAITNITEELLSSGLVTEGAPAGSGVGRPPVLLGINGDAKYALGLNIARRSCTVGVVDLCGRVLSKEQFVLNSPPTAEDALAEICRKITAHLQGLDLDRAKLLGLGVTTPGPVDAGAGRILQPPDFPLWHHVPVAGLLQERLQMAVALENTSVARALCEYDYGVGGGLSAFLLMLIDDNGIGGGLMIGGKPYKGFLELGSEIGHTCIQMDGVPCSCGGVGCLERYASIPEIVAFAQESDPRIISWEQIADGAAAGDALCLSVVEREAQYLGTGILNAVNLLSLQAVVLAGSVEYKPGPLRSAVERLVNARAIARRQRQVDILLSGVKADAGLVSAANLMLNTVFA